MRPIPSLIDLRSNIANDLRNRLNLSEDDLREVIDAFSAVEAAQIKLLYIYLSDILRNLFPDTADLIENGGQLERFGNIHLNRPINPATQGVYTANVTGEANSVLRAGLTFKSNDDSRNPGVLFTLDSEYTLTGSGDVIQIRSLVSGVDALLDVGNNLTITEPVVGVSQTISIASVVTEPRSAESVEDYRQSIIDSIQLEAQGGARTDYRLWAADAQGVRKVYPYVKEADAGTVQIYVEATISDSTDGEGTPSAALLTDVANVIEFDPDVTKPLHERGRRPIQAIIEVLPIVLTPVDVDITGLAQDTPEIRSSIESNLDILLRDIRPYIAGADLQRNKNDILYSARVQSSIFNTIGVANSFNTVVMRVNGVVNTSFEFTRANIPFLRNLNFN